MLDRLLVAANHIPIAWGIITGKDFPALQSFTAIKYKDTRHT